MVAKSTLLVALAVALVGCKVIQGSGVAKTEARTVGSFTVIEIQGSATVEFTVGPKQSVEVTSDDNLIQYIKTEVKGDKLVVSTEGSMSSQIGFKVKVVAPKLEAASISGSGDLIAEGVHAPSFDAAIAGSGSMKIVGKAGRLNASISGSGEMDLSKLQTGNAKATIAGSGDINLSEVTELDATISGSGDISYAGSPRVSKSISGSGDIHKR